MSFLSFLVIYSLHIFIGICIFDSSKYILEECNLSLTDAEYQLARIIFALIWLPLFIFTILESIYQMIFNNQER